MNVKTLSAMLGHVSAATTLDIYTHITGDMQRQAAANIDHRQSNAAGGRFERGTGNCPVSNGKAENDRL